MPRKLLTNKKSQWAANRKNVALRGLRLNYNASLQQKYVNALKQLVKQMTEETKKELKKLFHGDVSQSYFQNQRKMEVQDASISSKAKKLMNKLISKFQQLFNDKALPLAEKMMKQSIVISKSNLHSSLKQLSGGLSLKTSVVPKGMEDVSKALIAENVSLIKSIPQQYFKDITGAVMRSITTGNGLKDLVPEIQKYEGQTKRRAENLALDQTRKAYNSINKQKMQGIGVKQFEWIHSGGGQKPRESHLKMDGHIFDFENLEAQQAAMGVPKEDRGIPGQPINCRCTMLPVIKLNDGD